MATREQREAQRQREIQKAQQEALERAERARLVSKNEDPDIDKEENKWAEVYSPKETRGEYHDYKKPRGR